MADRDRENRRREDKENDKRDSPHRASRERNRDSGEKPRDREPEDTRRMYVANLGYRLREPELYAAFQKYGKIIDCKIIFDHATGNSKGYGFVTFDSSEDGKTAQAATNDKLELDGRLVVVEFATGKEREPGSGGSGRSSSSGKDRREEFDHYEPPRSPPRRRASSREPAPARDRDRERDRDRDRDRDRFFDDYKKPPPRYPHEYPPAPFTVPIPPEFAIPALLPYRDDRYGGWPGGPRRDYRDLPPPPPAYSRRDDRDYYRGPTLPYPAPPPPYRDDYYSRPPLASSRPSDRPRDWDRDHGEKDWGKRPRSDDFDKEESSKRSRDTSRREERRDERRDDSRRDDRDRRRH